MSYSRWSSSCWYTYSDVTLINNEPTFTINCEDSYPLSVLKENLESILDKYRQLRFDRNPRNYKGEGESPKDRYTEEEIKELKNYIDKFIQNHHSPQSEESEK